jgi:hypothetical protein
VQHRHRPTLAGSVISAPGDRNREAVGRMSSTSSSAAIATPTSSIPQIVRTEVPWTWKIIADGTPASSCTFARFRPTASGRSSVMRPMLRLA